MQMFRFLITEIYINFARISNFKKESEMETQTQLHTRVSKSWSFYKKCLPDVGRAYDELPMEVYKDGVLPGKMKRLMALTGALVHGCRACILFQTDEAFKAGVTAEEILEACSVAVSLGGTMAAGETARVVDFLNEKGLLEEFK